jgi:hypothetical protein
MPEHGSFIAQKACILRDIPWQLQCSGTAYKIHPVYLVRVRQIAGSLARTIDKTATWTVKYIRFKNTHVTVRDNEPIMWTQNVSRQSVRSVGNNWPHWRYFNRAQHCQLVSILKFLNRPNITHPNQTDDLVIIGQTNLERNTNTTVTLAQEKTKRKSFAPIIIPLLQSTLQNYTYSLTTQMYLFLRTTHCYMSQTH